MNSKLWKLCGVLFGVLALCAAAHAGWIEPDAAIALGFVGNMTNAQVRVIDPILSSIARGYKNNELVGINLFPYVPVSQRGGKVLEFGKESFKLYATGRTPGANTKRVNFGHSGVSFALEQHALEGVVPFEHQEEAAQVPGIDMGQGAVASTQDIIALRLEKAQADIARNAANYAASNKVTLAGGDQWSSYAASTPGQDIRAAVEAIRTQTGKRPNVVMLGAAVFAQLQEHPLILDRTKYTSKDSITPDILAALWSVGRVVVGDAVYADDADAMHDVWGKDVVIAYTQIGTVANRGLPSYGYTYRLGGYPVVEQPYYDRNTKSWIYPVTDEVSPVMAGPLAGFLIKDAVA